jgi:glycerol uptake facilitator-like aquaporin
MLRQVTRSILIIIKNIGLTHREAQTSIPPSDPFGLTVGLEATFMRPITGTSMNPELRLVKL